MAAPRSPRTIDRQSFDQFQTLLRELPPKPKEKFTIVEVAQELKPFIVSAITEKGYSPKELTSILKEKTGKTISVRQIKQVLQESSDPAPKRRPYTRRKEAVAEELPEEATVSYVNGHLVNDGDDDEAEVPTPVVEAEPAAAEAESAPEETKPKRGRGASKATGTTSRKTSSRTTAKKAPAKRGPQASKS